MTPYQKHCERWGKGCGSEHCGRASTRVLLRGDVPCEILFVGEAPGEAEDTFGRPFVGVAGKLLDRIVGRALEGLEVGGRPVRVAFTNVVACIPRVEDMKKWKDPDPDQVDSCRPRLEEAIGLCRPRVIVAVGKVAAQCFERGLKSSVKIPADCKVVHIIHPSNILQDNVAAQGLKAQRCEVQIRNAAEEL